MVNILREAGIPAFTRRARGFELPDFFGFGAREVLVRADRREEARRVLDPFDARPAPGVMPDQPTSHPCPPLNASSHPGVALA